MIGPLSVVAAGNTAGAVAAYLSKAFRTPTENIVIAEIWQGKVFRVLDADEGGLDKESDTFVAYAVKAAADETSDTGSGYSSLYSRPSTKDSEVVSVHIKQIRKDDDWASRSSSSYVRDDCYATPLILREEKEGLSVRKLNRRVNGILRTM